MRTTILPKTFSGLSSSALQKYIYLYRSQLKFICKQRKFYKKNVNQRFYHFLYSNDKFYKFYNGHGHFKFWTGMLHFFSGLAAIDKLHNSILQLFINRHNWTKGLFSLRDRDFSNFFDNKLLDFLNLTSKSQWLK